MRARHADMRARTSDMAGFKRDSRACAYARQCAPASKHFRVFTSRAEERVMILMPEAKSRAPMYRDAKAKLIYAALEMKCRGAPTAADDATHATGSSRFFITSHVRISASIHYAHLTTSPSSAVMPEPTTAFTLRFLAQDYFIPIFIRPTRRHYIFIAKKLAIVDARPRQHAAACLRLRARGADGLDRRDAECAPFDDTP